jgi:Skp family chaperone for outer membrane proteins
MARWNILAAGAVVVVGAALVAGASSTPKPPPAAPKLEESKPVAVVAQKTGYINMPRVMREFQWAASQGKALDEQRKHLSANVVEWRGTYIQTQQELMACLVPARKERLSKELFDLAYKIEAEDREITRVLNEAAEKITTRIQDNLRATVTEMAKERGLVAVIAYPEATPPDESNTFPRCDVKLKPPAAYPFYLDASVDYTDELVRRLNARFAADGGK